MHHAKSLLGCLIVCGLCATPAVAGGYAGIFLGSRTLEADWVTIDTFDPAGDSYISDEDSTETVSNSDRDLGVFAGHDWALGETGTWVAGVEADIQLMDNAIRIDRIPGLGFTFFEPTTSFVDIRTDGDATSLRGRIGYRSSVTPGLMVYGTAGLANLTVAVTATCPGDFSVCDPGAGTHSFENRKKMSGNTFGVGLEYTVGGSVLRAEYRNADFGDFSFVAYPSTDGSFGADATLDVTTGIFQIGVLNPF